MSTQSHQKQMNQEQEDKVSQLQFIKGKDTLDRVWKNLEKILDHFEEDYLKSTEELKTNRVHFPSKNYFNWDIEGDKMNRIPG